MVELYNFGMQLIWGHVKSIVSYTHYINGMECLLEDMDIYNVQRCKKKQGKV